MSGSKIIHNTEYFRQVVENSGDVIWVLDISTFRFSYMSPTVYQLNGFTAEEMMSLSIQDIMTKESYEYIIEQIPVKIREVLAGNSAAVRNTTEVDQYRKDGSIVYTEVVTTLIFKDDKPVEILGVTRDISHRKHIEKLVAILNTVTSAMQAALTPDEIYSAMEVALKKVNIESCVFIYDESTGMLRTRYLSYDKKILKLIEKLAGIKVYDFTVCAGDIAEYRDAIYQRKTSYVGDPGSFMEKILPANSKNLASQIIELLKVPGLIIAPLVQEDKVKGILALQSALFNSTDTEAVSMFANQLASSWHRGETFEKFRQEMAARKQVENELSITDYKYNNILNWSPVGIYHSAMDGQILAVNNSLATMLGYSHESELEKYDNMTYIYMYPQERAELIKKYKEKGEEVLRNNEFQWKKKDGSPIWILLTAHSIVDENNNFRYFEGFVQNIDAQKGANLELENSLSQLKATLESTNDGILVVNNKGNITNFNSRFTELWGISSDIHEDEDDNALLNSVLDKLTDPDAFLARVQEIYSTPGADSFDVIKLRNGRVFERYSHPQMLENKPVGRVWSFRDVTATVKAENEIRDREFWLSQSQKFARIGTYYLDAKSGHWKCTGTLDEIFGIDSNAQKNVESWISVIYEEDREMMAHYFQSYVLGGRHVFDKEYRIVRQNDKEIRWVHGRGDLTFDENKEVLAMVGTISDITERKLMEEELTEAKEKAEESSRLKTSLLLNISHELRTPMNGILGFAEILSSSIADPSQRKMAENILLSGNRLKTTLNSLVDLAQVQADAKFIRIEKTNIEQLVRTVVNTFKDVARTNHIQLDVSCAKDLVALTDPALLSNIVHQLVDNAVKFTDQGSVSIIIDEEKATDRAVIAVKDTGIGIESKNLKMIFEEFRQVSEGLGRLYEGTGLGLTLCRKFINLLSGEITVESEPGKGSVFTVRIPLSGVNVPAPTTVTLDVGEEMKESEDKGSNTLPVVLLVEDQEFNLELIEIYLEGICRTDRALDGSTAVKMAGERKYDAILMDVNLGPGMDGLEAAVKIRKMPGYENVPIIAVTGYSGGTEKEYILKRGCTHYLSKPYKRVNLVAVIRESLGM